jgi:hypothetical protein
MSDRLQELLRQRALVRDHLSWLDGEIAAEQNVHDQPLPGSKLRLQTRTAPSEAPAAQSQFQASHPPASPAPSGYLAPQAATIAQHAAAARQAPTASDENPAVAAAADAILEEYRRSPDALKTDIRTG